MFSISLKIYLVLLYLLSNIYFEYSHLFVLFLRNIFILNPFFLMLQVKLTFYHLLSCYNSALQSIIGSRRSNAPFDMSTTNDWLYLLECIDELNHLMQEDAVLLKGFGVEGTDGGVDFTASSAATAQSTVGSGECNGDGEGGAAAPGTKLYTLHCVRNRWMMLHENHFPVYSQKLGRETSSSQILRIIAIERCWTAALDLAKTIVLGHNRRTLENAADEAAWLSIPQTITPSYSSLSGLLPGLSKMSRKNKDGDGSKRKNRASGSGNPSADEVSPGGSSGPNEMGMGTAIPAEQALQRITAANSLGSHIDLVDEFVSNEEAFLSDLFNVLSKVGFCLF